MFLSLFFALALCFSFSTEASAHDYQRSDGQKTYTHSADIDVSAEMVEMAADADKEELTRKLLLHAATHLDLILKDEDLNEQKAQEKSKEAVIFAKAARDPGVFNHGDTYIIGITSPRGAVTNHGRYQHLVGSRYDLETEPVRTLTSADILSSDENAKPTCATYQYEGQSRVACAIRQISLSGVITTTAGFHHAEDILMSPDCSAFTLAVTAKDVEDETDLDTKRDLLRQYVQGVIGVFSTIQGSLLAEIAAEDPAILGDLQRLGAEMNARIREKTVCFREEQFYYGSIYAFVMDPVRGVSFLNGLDFDLHGLSVSLTDPNPIGDEPNVLAAFQKALTNGTGNVEDDLTHGSNGTVRYHWDDPRTEEDNVEDYIAKGVVPGTSVKESYLEVVDVAGGAPGFPPAYFVFGSGIYLEEESDDDGCAVASVGNAPQGALLNLFLIASVLFSVVFLRKRI